MAPLLADQYRRWFEYERDSHAKVLASLVAVPAGLRSAEDFQKAVDLMAHIIAARWLWLYRLGVAPEPPRELFFHGVPMDELQQRLRDMEHAWTAYVERLDDVEVTRVFEYRSLDGDRYRNTVQDILTQLFGHSWYHRGQIALLIRGLGCEPAVTDLLFWTREPIPEPAKS